MGSERDLREDVDLEKPYVFPKHETVNGKLVQLIPLHPEQADQLFESIGGDRNAALYEYMPYGPYSDSDIAVFRKQVEQFAKGKDPQFYTIVDLKTGQLMGWASFLRIDEKYRTIEIGHVLYSPALQRTRAATELQYLLADKAFQEGYRRLEWKCNAVNTASRRAALRLGYSFEGVFRQHMIVKGRNRDTAWFSILDKEWPSRKKALESWMDESNFDEDGRQRKDLSSIRKDIGADEAF